MRMRAFSAFLALVLLPMGCSSVNREAPAAATAVPAAASQAGQVQESEAKPEEAPVKVERFGSIQRYLLDNGLTVVVQPRKIAPVVAIQIWVEVGSADEGPGEEGLAHLHEHMLFKGTEKRPVGEIAKDIEGAGGEINAWTSFDHTVYHVVLASRFFDLGLEVLADAVQHASFDAGELEREKKVVFEEMKRSRDIPGRWINDLLFESAFQAHPYHRPILGKAATLKKIGRGEILSFFRHHYLPPRMTVLVVGDIEPEQVLKRVQALFPGKRSRAATEVERPAEPGQRKLRVRIEQDDIQEAYFNLGWHISSVKGPEIPALDVLATLLGQGESARLVLELKRSLGLVNDVYAYAYSPKDPGLFVVGGSCKAEKLVPALKQLSLEVAKLGNLPVGAAELGKVKAMIESDALYAQETVEGTARRIGYYQVNMGDPAYGDTYLSRAQAVTPDEIRQTVATYFREGNLSVVLVLPKNAAVSEEDVRRAIAEGIAEAPSGEAEPAAAQGNVTRVKIKNGPVLLVEEEHSNALVSLRAAYLGGVRFESDANQGINNFLAGMITRGTTSKSAAEIAKAVDSIAGSLSGFSGRNSFGLRAEFPSRHFDRGLALFADCLLQSSFPEKEIKRERELVIEEIRSRDDNLSGLAFDLFAATLYPTHPYRLNVLGTRASVAAFRRAAMVDYLADHYRPEDLVISVVGDVDTPKVVEQVKALFTSPPSRKKTAAPTVALDPPPKEIRKAIKHRAKAQAHVVLGFMGTTLSSEDRFPLEVLTAVLAGQGGRLFLELRDKKSLAYSVTGFSLEGIEPGYLAVYLGVDPKRVEEAVAGVKEQLLKVTAEPISAEELKRAQQYLVGTNAISLQKASARAAVMAFDEMYGQGHLAHRKYPEKILAVTADDVLRMAKKYIRLDAYVLAVVSPESTGAP